MDRNTNFHAVELIASMRDTKLKKIESGCHGFAIDVRLVCA